MHGYCIKQRKNSMRLYIFLFLFIGALNINAQTAPNKTDEKGLKQGYWIKMNPTTGKPAYKGTFKDDKPVGVFKYYYSEIDTIKTIMDFRNNGTVGYATIFYMTGKKQAQGKYINEKKDSIWTFYDDMGQLLSLETYKDGKKEGKSLVYFQNGEIADEKLFKNDIQHGPFKQFFEGKKVRGEGTYVEGKLVGKNSYYYPNGTIAATGYYNDKGNKYGVWIYKDKDGKVISKDVFDNGKQLSGKEADAWLLKNKGKEPKAETTKNTKGKTTDSGKPSKTPAKSTAPAKGAKK